MRALFGCLLQVGAQPLQLLLADRRHRIGHVVDHDEMHALVVERVVRLAEELLERLAVVERRVVLPGHEPHVLHLECAHDLAELGHAPASLLRVVGRMGQVAGEHHEIGLTRQPVDRRDRFLERSLRVRVDRSVLEAPVTVRELHEVEFVVRCGARRRHRGRATGHQDRTAQPGEPQEITPAQRFGFHDRSM